jgi:hypothetical protein
MLLSNIAFMALRFFQGYFTMEIAAFLIEEGLVITMDITQNLIPGVFQSSLPSQ